MTHRRGVKIVGRGPLNNIDSLHDSTVVAKIDNITVMFLPLNI
jgi:hypothetical protein